jgi:hypothetical protein
MAEVSLSSIKLLHTVNYEDKSTGLKFADGALYLASAALGYEDLTLIKGKVDTDGNPLFESVTKVDNVFLRFLAGLAAIVTLPLTLVGLVVKWCLQNKQTEEIQSIRNKAVPPKEVQTPPSSLKHKDKHLCTNPLQIPTLLKGLKRLTNPRQLSLRKKSMILMQRLSCF